MTKHTLTYIDLHPQPVEGAEDTPSTWCIVLSMTITLMLVMSAVLFAFSL